MKRHLSKKMQGVIIALGLAALWLAGLFWFVRQTYDMTPVMAQSADAIVVLTGGNNRIQTGFDLLEQGLASKLFISGVYRGVDVRELIDSVRHDGDDKLECCIDLGSANNTIENARETVAWVQKQGFSTFYLVTANYHMRRALLEFDNIDHGYTIIPWPVTPEQLDMQDWWRNGDTRGVIIREYVKYLLALLRHAAII